MKQSPSPRPTPSPAGVGRRTVVRTSAWAVPVVSAASVAPAFAASPCSTPFSYLLNWSPTDTTFSRTASSATAYATAAGASSLKVSFASAYIGGTQQGYTFDATYNLSVPGASGGGVAPNVTNLGALGTAAAPEYGLCLQHSASATTSTNATTGDPSRGQQVTITFDRAVTNLSFWIVDVDSTNGYWDRVRFTTAAPTVSQASTNVLGAGTGNNPFKYGTTQSSNSNLDENTNQARVKVSFPGPTTSLVLQYWNQNVVSGTTIQRVFLSDFSFTALGC